MIGKAIKKPVVIDFIKWNNNIIELINWVKSFNQLFSEKFSYDLIKDPELKVKTLEGTSYAVPKGYIIIRGVKGEYYPCDPNIFYETYEIQ